MKPGSIIWRLAGCLFWAVVSASACGGSYEETIGSVKVPIPGGMTKSKERGMEVSLPGFGGAQVAYQGNVDPDRIIEFYRKEMPARGWEPGIGLLSQGGMLTYVKDNKTVMVTVGKTDSGSSLTITVAGAQR